MIWTVMVILFRLCTIDMIFVIFVIEIILNQSEPIYSKMKGRTSRVQI